MSARAKVGRSQVFRLVTIFSSGFGAASLSLWALMLNRIGDPGMFGFSTMSAVIAGLAALAGFSEVAGLKGNLTLDLSPGFGYTGIVVAMLAMLNPLGVVASAIFVAGIFVGADAMSRSAGVPSYIAQVMVATALLTMVTAIMLTRYRIKWR